MAAWPCSGLTGPVCTFIFIEVLVLNSDSHYYTYMAENTNSSPFVIIYFNGTYSPKYQMKFLARNRVRSQAIGPAACCPDEQMTRVQTEFRITQGQPRALGHAKGARTDHSGQLPGPASKIAAWWSTPDADMTVGIGMPVGSASMMGCTQSRATREGLRVTKNRTKQNQDSII